MKCKNFAMDMCTGGLLSKIILFALPLLVMYVLQMLFGVVDYMILGRHAHYNATAAVGSVTSLNGLMINGIIGTSVGTNVVVARLFGNKDFKLMQKAISTSMTIALYAGIVLMVIGLIVAKPILIWMETPPEILPLSCTYIRICLYAVPFISVYNFGYSILRAIGDTRRPMIILLIAGVINVLLNLFFVVVCGMDVKGVAWATFISHGVATVLVVGILLKTTESYQLILNELGSFHRVYKEVLRLGIPSGVQSSLFSVANVAIQSSINTFGALAMAGSAAVLSLEGLIYIMAYAFQQTTISFVSQNYGGKQYRRVGQSICYCMVSAFILTSVIGWLLMLFGRHVLAWYNPNEEVIGWGLQRMKILFVAYGICGIMDIICGGLRGLGYSTVSAVIVLLGVGLFRIVWVFLIFPHFKTMNMLMLAYPISWCIVAVVGGVTLIYVYRKLLIGSSKL